MVNYMGSKKVEELRHQCGRVSENQNISAQGLATNFSKDSVYYSIKFSLSPIVTIIELRR